MSEELSAGCERPAGGPVEEVQAVDPVKKTDKPIFKERKMIQVGKKAPDFTAAGYHNNNFVNVTLSEHLGKWVVLCFYPGDFTFV
jgi:peroxiredoxin (alkyl hydroperoxide reductase subunit C)